MGDRADPKSRHIACFWAFDAGSVIAVVDFLLWWLFVRRLSSTPVRDSNCGGRDCMVDLLLHSTWCAHAGDYAKRRYGARSRRRHTPDLPAYVWSRFRFGGTYRGALRPDHDDRSADGQPIRRRRVHHG